jgi:O-antigen/teichoic acid export membrane protein
MKINKIASNFVSLSMINVVGMVIPILLIPFLTRVVGVELLAGILLVNTVQQFGILLSDYSFNITGTRVIAENRKNHSFIVQEYRVTQVVRLFIAVSYILFSVLVFYLWGNIDTVAVFLNLFFGIIGQWLLSVWYYQGLSKLGLISVITSLSKVLFFLFVLLFATTKEDVNSILIAYNLPLFILALVFFTRNINDFKASTKINFKMCATKINSGFNVFIGDFAPNLYNNIPSIVLGISTGGANYTYYSIATRVTGAFVGFQHVLSRALFPNIVGHGKKKIGLIIKLNLILLLPFLVFIFLYSNQVVFFFIGQVESTAVFYLKLLSLSVFFNGIINIINQGYLLPNGKDVVFRNISLSVSIFSAISGVFLIYYFGIVGLIYTQLLARVSLSIALFLYYILE